jgi:3-hydroxyacyl-[acyl-carrier-protein] dehydratase
MSRPSSDSRDEQLADRYDPEILKAIPHRPPMLLVEKIVRRQADSVACLKTFRPDEFFFGGHYPGNPIVPGVILCEVAAQTAALLLALTADVGGGVPLLGRLNNVKLRQPVRPGDTVESEAWLTDQLANAFFLSVRVTRGAKPVLTLDLACMWSSVE